MHNLIIKITCTLKYIIMIMMVISLASSESLARSKLHVHNPGNPVKAASKATKSAGRGASRGAKSSVRVAKAPVKTAKTAKRGVTKAAKAPKKAANRGFVNKVKSAGKGVGKGFKKAEKGVEKGAKGIEKKMEDIVKKLLSNTKFLQALLNPALKMAKLPTMQDIQTTAKCFLPTKKKIAVLFKKAKNPTDPSIPSLLEEMKTGKCYAELEALIGDCGGPGAGLASMTPAGGFIGHMCGMTAALKGQVDGVIAHLEQAIVQAKIAKRGAKAIKNKDADGVIAVAVAEQSGEIDDSDTGSDSSNDDNSSGSSDDSGDSSDSASDEG